MGPGEARYSGEFHEMARGSHDWGGCRTPRLCAEADFRGVFTLT